MPKEVIHDPTPVIGEQSTPFAVEVQWGRDSDVRIGSVNLENSDGEKRFTSEYGWFATLRRQDVNVLIRVLRKARDQAYGVDE